MPTWTKEQAKAATSRIVAFDNDVKAGSLLIACRDTDLDSGDPTDSRGNSWSSIRNTLTPNGQTIEWWYAISNGAGACTVTFSIEGSFNGYIIAEYSVDAGAISEDVENGVYRSTTGAGTDKFQTASVNPSAPSSLMLSFAGSDSGAVSDLAAGTGCVLDAQGALSNSSGDRVALESDLTVDVGAQTFPWSTTGNWDGQIQVAIFKTDAPPPADTGLAWIRAMAKESMQEARQHWQRRRSGIYVPDAPALALAA